MTETKKSDPGKLEEVLQAAEEVFRKNPDWVAFFREVLGLGGLVRRTFTTPEQMAEFEHSDACRGIQRMLTKLRARPIVKTEPQKTGETELQQAIPETEPGKTTGTPKSEPTKVITVRLPVSLHVALQEEAHEHRTSVNKLCISKLLQFIDHDFVPARQGGVQEGTP
jgi:hypothetical protein